MTYLQLINSVLRRLREDEVATVSQSNYAKLIGDFVNETKREVEDAWNWVQLRDTIQVTTVASTFRYTLTDAGNRYRILQVLNDTEDMELRVAPYKWMNAQLTGTPQESAPLYFDINGSSSGDPNTDMYPVPDKAYTINYNMIIPQADFTADADELTVPSWPVILGAYAKALSERGEDGGTQFAEAASMYQMALSDAIAIDTQKVPHEIVWESV